MRVKELMEEQMDTEDTLVLMEDITQVCLKMIKDMDQVLQYILTGKKKMEFSKMEFSKDQNDLLYIVILYNYYIYRYFI